MGDTGTWVGVADKPSVVSAVASALSVRVTFSQPMTNNADLRNATYYPLTHDGGSVAVAASAVTPGPGTYPTYVDLTVNDMTIGTNNYHLAVDSSLENQYGDSMNPAGRTADFNGASNRATVTARGFASDLTLVEITYSKAVKQVNPANGDDALNPTNYNITGGVTVNSATHVTSSIVNLNVSGQQIGHAYTGAVSNVQDLANNVVAP